MSFVDVLIDDAEDLVLGSLLGPSWGIYLGGVPVIQPASIASSGNNSAAVSALAAIADVASLIGTISGVSLGNVSSAVASTIDFEYSQDWPLPNYPQEQGAFQSYNKQTLPFDVKVKLASAGNLSDRQAFLQTCLAIAQSFSLFDVVTPEMVFPSCNVTHIDWRREAKRGYQLIQVDLYFLQIPVISSTTFNNTQQPGEAGVSANGVVQSRFPSENEFAPSSIQ